ncbi:hypothetical protein ACRRTK_015691 [Alexandromys fortis]
MDGLCGSLVCLDVHLPGPGGNREDLGLPIGIFIQRQMEIETETIIRATD